MLAPRRTARPPQFPLGNLTGPIQTGWLIGPPTPSPEAILQTISDSNTLPIPAYTVGWPPHTHLSGVAPCYLPHRRPARRPLPRRVFRLFFLYTPFCPLDPVHTV